MKIISWNCRGVGGPRAVRALCDVTRSHRPSIIGLIETKKAGDNWESLKLKLGFRGCFAVGSQGRSGGLALLWEEGLKVVLMSYSTSHIDVLVKGEHEFYLTLFYGHPKLQERTQSWELLRRLKRVADKPWVVIGDFNEIAYSWEWESRRTRQAWQMENFRRCLDDCNLLDLGYKGGPFTYSNKRKEEQEVKARLDRAVANQGWRSMFPKALVNHSFANSSDHIPIVIYTDGIKRAHRQDFKRFEPMWLRHTAFKDIVKEAWLAQPEEANLTSKLCSCMSRLSQWDSKVFGDVKKKVKELKERIGNLRGSWRTEEVAKEEANLSAELDEWMEREELYWRQRSRAEWLRNGDRNTSYFHAKASQRKKRNQIDGLRNNRGELCEDEHDIDNIITDYFNDIFHSQVALNEGRWCSELNVIPKLVKEEMNTKLTAQFTEGEVKRALFQMHPTKAPGLDGFSALFYQSNWSTVGRDVVKEVLECLNEGVLKPEWNETLIVLVPKVKKVERMEELRPISLCNVVMKIVTKVLANRLKELLPSVISQNQSAFVEGRLITDNILIAHEVLHFIKGAHKQKTGYVSIKLDMSKAYDRLEWKFLERMMLSMGFSIEWVKKVMMCVTTVKYRVRINDRISDRIIPTRGLRQGDPISPYLFLICAEWLTHTLNKYQELGLIQGAKICRGAPTITHLMFADDCLLFLKARRDALHWVRSVLHRYELISGQKVNLAKSEVFCSKSVQDTVKGEISGRMGMKLVDAHSNYLGLPTIFTNQKVALFRLVEEKVMRKIRDWKYKLLSGAGREVLIKFVLQAIPLYAMSYFKIPLSICRRVAGDLVNFWWHKNRDRGIHWLKAEVLYKEKGEGGLGFRRFELMNMAMLAKQGWRLMTQPNLLVSRVFKAKYFNESELMNATVGMRPSFAWRGIMEAVGIIRFGVEWDETEGRYRWKKDGSGTLTVKGAYKCAVEMDKIRSQGGGEQSDPGETHRFWRSFWRLKVPNKIKMFGWRLFHNCLPTMQNLEKRGCLVHNRCSHCDVRGEDAIHIFKNCWWVRGLLQGLNLPSTIWNNQCEDSGYWLWLCAKLCTEEEFKCLLFALWLCWWDRNCIVHGKEGRNIEHWIARTRWLMMELRGVGLEGKTQPIGKPEIRKGLYIMCDGSFDSESRKAGWSAILCSDGKVERVSAGWWERASSVLEAECMAIEKGLDLANSLKIPRVKLLTDSTEAIWALNLGSWRPGIDLFRIERCIKALDEHQGWSLEGILREDNSAADWLARKARIEQWEWSNALAIPMGLPSSL
ncbi:unnamed protein product [Rhodiola kirilowii]